ncbi:D-alanyl-lipoteichoic acid biosynthesis protein DltB [uncultured Clostridium sp.]|uniref:D-alanyl-lipoteichoic acid biosynthesis protein DltB n=1 Tax=uncultured Clostridium sp. TaxID=59620 RepID=UPI00261D046F|nr:D-alanyl-lipoteichoic acid biosynthesis protein DltB [uncultured Clostridium sp.]
MFPLIQYGTYFYMYLLFLVTIPAFILGAMGKRIKVYGMVATIFMIFVILGTGLHLLYFAVFIIWEVLIVFIYLEIRRRTDSIIKYRICLFLSLIPMLIFEYTETIRVKLPIGNFAYNGHKLGYTNEIWIGVVTFMGLAYLNFRVLQMIIEIYDGTITEVKLGDFLYYVTFFPALSSGPIDRSRRFDKEANNRIPRNIYLKEYALVGIRKLILGVFYKFILSYLIYTYWLMKIPHELTFLHAAAYAYGYTFYLFFNFAGYCLMAVGTSYFFGVKTPDNFKMPFISKDMKEFWTRWNITLSKWLGDYLYSRFVISSMRKKRFKSRYTASHIAQFMTMLIIGCWHGITWYYILYGFLQGLMLVLTDIFQRKSKFYKRNKKKTWFKIVSIIVTFNIVVFLLLIFSGYFSHFGIVHHFVQHILHGIKSVI